MFYAWVLRYRVAVETFGLGEKDIVDSYLIKLGLVVIRVLVLFVLQFLDICPLIFFSFSKFSCSAYCSLSVLFEAITITNRFVLKGTA